MIEVVTPQEGKVTIELSYDDAEVLCRILGMTNTGNLTGYPELFTLADSLTKEFGRNITSEARKFLGSTTHGQVYVHELRG